MPDERLAELLLRWEETWEHGQDVPASQLCADCPELTEQLQKKIDALKKMEWMKEEPEATEDGLAAKALIGKILAGRYRIEELVGEGGFGRVYRAFDPELQRPVAIKIPKSEWAEPDNLLEEARKIAKLRCPGIVAVHDVGRDGDVNFIVSDLISGTNLADLIANNRPKPLEAARLVAEIAENLYFAHEQGFIHRDIKPANILIDQQGKPLITDFGIAKTAEEVVRKEEAGSGTLPYMAPEQLSGEIQLIDARTDIYALGVVLYELLTGRLPYQARTPLVLREQILFRMPGGIRSIAPGVSSELERICLRCLAKHPADRFHDGKELAGSIRACCAPRSLRRWWALLALVVVAVISGILASRFLPSRSHREVPKGVLVFDGTTRIVTPLERFIPVTLEAWVRPDRYEDRNHYVIGSDVINEWGYGLAIGTIMLSVEYVEGNYRSNQVVPVREWSHLAAVFAPNETRLYFNGKMVAAGPATKKAESKARFVVGNAGENNPLDYYLGQIRSVRISKGERYPGDFIPDEEFKKDAENTPSKAMIIYDGRFVDGDQVIDQSGNGNDGRLETAR